MRYLPDACPSTVRHLGWEDDTADGFSQDTDCNGILWEQFSPAAQLAEIEPLRSPDAPA